VSWAISVATMADWDDVLGDLDSPRPLAPSLRDRLEEQLTGGSVALLLADADQPRPLSPGLRDRLLVELVRPVPAWRRPGALAAAAAAAAGIAAAAALLVPGGTTAPRTTAQGPAAVTSAPPSTDAAPGSASAGFGTVVGPPIAPSSADLPSPAASVVRSSAPQADSRGAASAPRPAAAPAAAAPGAPTTSRLYPASGPFAGGTLVTVTGSGFTADVVVRFGDVRASAVEVVSPTTLRVTSPAHLPGEVGVTVSNGVGTSAPLTYRYVA